MKFLAENWKWLTPLAIIIVTLLVLRALRSTTPPPVEEELPPQYKFLKLEGKIVPARELVGNHVIWVGASHFHVKERPKRIGSDMHISGTFCATDGTQGKADTVIVPPNTKFQLYYLRRIEPQFEARPMTQGSR